MNKQITQAIGFTVFSACMFIVVFVLIFILLDIFFKGINIISLKFIFDVPFDGMTKGGIFPAIAGTFFLSILTTVFSVPLGMGCAIYLNEYAKDNMFTRLIRISIRNLSGVPSVVFGLFGVVLFVQLLKFGTSLLSACLTLTLLTLPWIITASEEALKNVPNGFRNSSLALGATKWQMIRTVVLPYAIPGMLTGAILGLARAAGETAPILFTGVAFFIPFIPKSVFDQFMALPYHLYIMATQHHAIEQVRPIAYGTALVLVVLVFTMNLLAVILRYKLRKIYSRKG